MKKIIIKYDKKKIEIYNILDSEYNDFKRLIAHYTLAMDMIILNLKNVNIYSGLFCNIPLSIHYLNIADYYEIRNFLNSGITLYFKI